MAGTGEQPAQDQQAAEENGTTPPRPLRLPSEVGQQDLRALLRPIEAKPQPQSGVGEGYPAGEAMAPMTNGNLGGGDGIRSGSKGAWLLQVAQTKEQLGEGGRSTYLWEARSDAQLLEDVSSLLEDIEALSLECDELYRACLAEAAAEAEAKNKRPPTGLDMTRLHPVTQRLIDRFGVRSAAVLERIGTIYSALDPGTRGLNPVELRGYIASVLVQVRRELESRPPPAIAPDAASGSSELAAPAAPSAGRPTEALAAAGKETPPDAKAASEAAPATVAGTAAAAAQMPEAPASAEKAETQHVLQAEATPANTAAAEGQKADARRSLTEPLSLPSAAWRVLHARFSAVGTDAESGNDKSVASVVAAASPSVSVVAAVAG
eukprot:TRINITY_DN47106_c0_g1_i1.p1 TRINITY_DN47106_c0_g1~~TRINITY_DN47106_c0_g1_i1.p1  ORF type:complete len:378 (-),score=101.30 TRINITY_DN47106_c0_g1_i1:149-1282(-)